MEKLIPINITEGHLARISLDFKDNDNKLEVSATVELRAPGGEKITEAIFSSAGYFAQRKIDVPIDIIPLAGQIREIVENTCILKINERQEKLNAPK